MVPVKRDPAPSRVKYRLERLWLTPLIRRLVRVGLPAGLLIGLGALLVTDARVTTRLAAAYGTLRATLAQHPDLTVHGLDISGAGPDLAARIEAALALDLPASALDLDLDALRARVAALGPVAAAEARFASDNRLVIEVTERVPVALTPGDTGFVLIDLDGAEVARVEHRAARPDLPLLAGPGAADAVPEALALLAIAAPIGDRVRGAVRIGARRWDLALAPDLTVRLPEAEADAALRRLIALHAAKRLLDRDLTVVDLRDPLRPVVRLSPRGLALFLGLPGSENEL